MPALQIEHTPIWADIRDILNSGKKPVRFEFKGMLHTEKEDIPVLKIASIDIVRDYVNHIGDHIQIVIKMPLGEYIYRLYPYKTNIEFTIKKILLEEVSTGKEKDSLIQTERYKAVFIPDENPVVSGTELELYDIESLNKADIVDVKLQLLNRSLEPLRIKTVHGIYRQATAKKLIHSLVAGESSKVLVDGKPSVDGFDLVEPDNSEVKQHVIIPNGTHITSVPSFLQEKMGGVYSSGIGTYLQKFNNKRMWFVYPLYNVKRFEENVEKLIIYAVPEERLSGSDRTYKKDGKVIHIVATAAKKFQENADTDFINEGVGFRMPDARAFMKKPVELTQDGPKGQRTGLNHEVAISSRSDGLNYAPVTKYGPSSNPFREYSKIAARNVSRLDLVWENANPDLLYPGMPIKYIFIRKNKLVELTGILLFVHAFSSLQGTTLTASSYRTLCQLSMVVERVSSLPEIPSIEAYGDF